jgi:hypothetical protein
MARPPAEDDADATFAAWLDRKLAQTLPYLLTQMATLSDTPWHCIALVTKSHVRRVLCTQVPGARAEVHGRLVARRPADADAPRPPETWESSEIGFVVSHFATEDTAVRFADELRGRCAQETRFEVQLRHARSLAEQHAKDIVAEPGRVRAMYGQQA